MSIKLRKDAVAQIFGTLTTPPGTLTTPPGAVKPKPKRSRKPKPRPVLPPIPVGDRVLGLDVSSTATGAAVVEVTRSGVKILNLALSKPPAKWGATARVDCMIDVVMSDVGGLRPEQVVLEMTDGATWGGRSRTNNIVQLAIAQGRFYESARRYYDVERIDVVTSTVWTHGVPKGTRAAKLAAIYPELAEVDNPPHHDVADALGLALWRIYEAGGTHQ